MATGAFLLGALGSLAIRPDEGRWTQTNDFDRWMRTRLRLGSRADRDRARDASDVLVVLSINQLVVDAVVVSWWGHGSGDVAWQLTMMDVEAIAFNAMANGVIAGVSSRQRPYAERCADPYIAHTRDCTQDRRYRSFYSGHTSTAFTAAGLTCMHHAHLPLYGGGAGEALACSSAFLSAAAVGALRVVSDQHYVSDVMAGAAIGTLSGLGIPWLLHYRGGELSAGPPAPDADPEAAAADGASSFAMGALPGPLGAVLWGVF